MGAATSPHGYVIAWLLLGLAMAGLLYDAAFAVVTHAFGPEYRRGITLITLVGGLASTVFVPVAQLAVDELGWRGALAALGVFQILVGVPLHLWGVPRFVRLGPAKDVSAATITRLHGWLREFAQDVSDPRFVGLALWFTAHAAAFTGLIFLIVPILQALGVGMATILQAIAVIGPMQVLGRFLVTARGGHCSSLRIGAWAMAAVAGAMAILLVLPPKLGWLIAFAALYGLGNGVMTIVRGTSIAELFGRDRYAELNGALAAPAVLAKAGSPLAMAALWSASGQPRSVFVAVLGCVLVGVAGLWLVVSAQRRLRRPA
jgi:MFS family permease